jgi:hypothetical protein
MPYAPKWERLTKSSQDELVKIYDEQAERTVVGLDFILEELVRRRQERGDNIIVWSTVVIAVATVVNVAVLIWQVVGTK